MCICSYSQITCIWCSQAADQTDICLQAYGDAVVDEAPLLFISNYECTVFLKRSVHVYNKTLWASEPIWWDQQHPSACACWLQFLHLADEMQDRKPKLLRREVPRTANGYMPPQLSIVDPPLEVKKGLRPRAQPAIMLMASSESHKGYDLVRSTPHATSSLQQQPAGTVKGDMFSLCQTCCKRTQPAYA